MSLLAPLFLAGLAALAIPVLIHLIQRERKNVVQFPSLMFVRKIPYSSIRRRRIHNWMLLMMRLAALLLVVMAFARPFMRGTTLAASSGGARDVVILLDRSYSMGHGDQWDRARRAAVAAVNDLSAGDRAALVLFASGAEVAVQSTDDDARLMAEINAAELSAGATRFGPAIKLAGSLLATSNLPRREVVIISDFQRAGWSPGDGLRLPAGTVLTPVVVQASTTNNLSATPVSIQREHESGQNRMTVTAGVLNRSADAVENVPVALELDGRVVQTQPVNVGPNGSASITFAPIILTTPDTRAAVRIPNDALAQDNAFHFVLSPPQPVNVALVNTQRSTRDSALYLIRALDIGDTPRFEVASRQLDDLSDDTLAKTRVVILNDASPSDAVVSRLKRFVENGGGLLVVFGPQSAWPASAEELLPALPTGNIDRSRGSAGALGGLEYGHAMFEPFRAPRSGDFSAARFYGYRGVTAAKGAQVLARFDDGGPAVVDKPFGRGRVVLWTSTLDLYWNDLPLKPVFLPFVHQVTRYLADYRERARWATVGQVIDLTQETDVSTSRVALSPSGKRIPLESQQGAVLELGEPGFYEVRRQGRDGGPVLVAASNVELAESDRTAIDPQDIVAAVVGGPAATGSDGEPVTLSDETQERTQRVWWYLLFAGILLLTAESVVAHRMSRANT